MIKKIKKWILNLLISKETLVYLYDLAEETNYQYQQRCYRSFAPESELTKKIEEELNYYFK